MRSNLIVLISLFIISCNSIEENIVDHNVDPSIDPNVDQHDVKNNLDNIKEGVPTTIVVGIECISFFNDAWKKENGKLISQGDPAYIGNGSQIATFKVKFSVAGKYYFYFNANVLDLERQGMQDSFFAPNSNGWGVTPTVLLDGWEGHYIDANNNNHMSNIPTWYRAYGFNNGIEHIIVKSNQVNTWLDFNIGVRQPNLTINKIMFSLDDNLLIASNSTIDGYYHLDCE